VYGGGGYPSPPHGRLRPGRREPFDLAAGRFEPTCPRCAAPLLACEVEEDAPVAPRTVYAATKVAQEHLAAAWAGLTGGTALALRYAGVFGPGMRTGVAATFRAALDRGEPPRVFEDGGQRRDFVHVTDAARATVAALGAAKRDGFSAYHVCSGQPRTVGELATALATAGAGPAPVRTEEFRADDVRHLVPSARRARAELGFTARVSFADGIADLVPARA
jgi:dTDP-L-rhamnose 4-epimerase